MTWFLGDDGTGREGEPQALELLGMASTQSTTERLKCNQVRRYDFQGIASIFKIQSLTNFIRSAIPAWIGPLLGVL